jgi:hypothetical protein
MFDAPTSAGTDADYMELSQSTELNLPPKSWANGREELIHRLKENSPWRHQHTVCLSHSGIFWALGVLQIKSYLFTLTSHLYLILTLLTCLIVTGYG